MRILILTQFYHPEPVDKVVDFAERLHKLGHEVEVLTGFPCYPRGATYPGYRQALARREKVDGISIIRVPQFPDHSRSIIRRMLYYVTYALSAMTIGMCLVRKADVMYVYQSALPTGLAAWWISRARGIPYILDVVDLWPESVAASGMLSNRLLLKVIRLAARFTYSRANQIAVITEGYRARLLRMGIPQEKLKVIYHWKKSNRLPESSEREAGAQAKAFAGRFNVVYSGNVGPCQSLETVLQCAELVKKKYPALQFLIIGDGMDLPRLKAVALARKLTNVCFLGWRPVDAMLAFYAIADALLVHLESTSMSKISIPSKTIGYLAAGRSLLMGVDGEASRFVKQNRCGRVFTPGDAQSLAAAVLDLYSMSPNEREALGAESLRAYQEHFQPDKQAAKMLGQMLLCTARPAAKELRT